MISCAEWYGLATSANGNNAALSAPPSEPASPLETSKLFISFAYGEKLFLLRLIALHRGFLLLDGVTRVRFRILASGQSVLLRASRSSSVWSISKVLCRPV